MREGRRRGRKDTDFAVWMVKKGGGGGSGWRVGSASPVRDG